MKNTIIGFAAYMGLIILVSVAVGIISGIIMFATKHIELSLIASCIIIGMAFGAMFTIGFYSFIFNKDK